MEAKDCVRKLSEAIGITGEETPVRQVIQELWEPYVDELRVGNLGSLIALKRGSGPKPRPKLMLAAHMDEIGLRVTGIEKGFLRVTRVGGTDRRVLLGTDVTVHGKRDLPGLVATRPPHVLPKEERKKTVPWDKIFVDVGLPPDEVEDLVSVGDLISIDRQVSELKNGRLAGKAMDDRCCVGVLTLMLEHLANWDHVWDVIPVATVQEEIGIKGAIASTYDVAPDLGIALDVNFGDQPGISDVDTIPMGKGPVIGIGPNFHPKLAEEIKKTAESHEIPYQLEPVPGRLGTDAWAIQVTREGIPTALISIPLRYMHQPVETLDIKDIERAARLLATFIGEIGADFLDKLAWDDVREEESE